MGHNTIVDNNIRSGKFAIYAILLFQLVLIGSLIKGIQVSYKSRERVELLQNKKTQLEGENIKLKEDAAYVQSEYYIEKVAREELQRAKLGEQVVILPENDTQYAGHSVQKTSEDRVLSNWEKWWLLLVK